MQTRRAIYIAIALCLVPGTAVGQFSSPQMRSMVIGWTRLTFVSGRIINANQWPMTRSTNISGDGTKEEIVFEGNGATGTLRYHRESKKQETKKQDFLLEVNSDGKFHFHWQDSGTEKSDAEKNGPDKSGDGKCDVELTQNPNDMITLSVDVAGKKKFLRGNTFWHLWIADPELCRKHVAPILETLRPGWSVASNGTLVETELLHLAAAGQHSDRKQWSAWVDQLADPQFMKRKKADDKLRAAGPPILGYLRQVNVDQLDPVFGHAKLADLVGVCHPSGLENGQAPGSLAVALEVPHDHPGVDER